MLAAGGIDGIPALAIPAVLPLLFSMERVRLDKSEERVLRIFGARPGIIERMGKPDELYASLPADVRTRVSLDEFTDYLASAVAAGAARGNGEWYEVLPNGETVFRLTIR